VIVAETPHLRLRRWRRDDIDTLFRWATDPRMMEHMGRGPFSRAEAERMLDRTLHHYRGYGFGVWLAEDRETGEPVGRVGLSYHRAWPDDPEVGWWIDPSRWGEGLATEAGEAAIEYAFEGLGFRRVVSLCTEDNLASRRVMEKLELRKLTEVPFPELDLVLWVHARQRAAASA
jgi:RimJ/RimL family protein N-acetyltransferase